MDALTNIIEQADDAHSRELFDALKAFRERRYTRGYPPLLHSFFEAMDVGLMTYHMEEEEKKQAPSKA
jgi:hypothetical protein